MSLQGRLIRCMSWMATWAELAKPTGTVESPGNGWRKPSCELVVQPACATPLGQPRQAASVLRSVIRKCWCTHTNPHKPLLFPSSSGAERMYERDVLGRLFDLTGSVAFVTGVVLLGGPRPYTLLVAAEGGARGCGRAALARLPASSAVPVSVHACRSLCLSAVAAPIARKCPRDGRCHRSGPGAERRQGEGAFSCSTATRSPVGTAHEEADSRSAWLLGGAAHTSSGSSLAPAVNSQPALPSKALAVLKKI